MSKKDNPQRTASPPTKSAPYDQRNAADYQAMTRRIEAALETVRSDLAIKPTQTNLARLAGCSRETLRLREWPLQALAEIGQQRHHASGETSGRTRPTRDRQVVESPADTIDTLKREIVEANARYFEAVTQLRVERTRHEDVLKVLRRETLALKQEKAELVRRILELESPAGATVLSMPTRRDKGGRA